jgi:hypothetical protein
MLLAKLRLIHDTPALRTCHLDKLERWKTELADVLAQRLGVDPQTDSRPDLLAATALAVLDVTTRPLARDPRRGELALALDSAFELAGSLRAGA